MGAIIAPLHTTPLEHHTQARRSTFGGHDNVLHLDDRTRARYRKARICDNATDALHLQTLCHSEPELLPRWHQDDRGWQNRSRGYHELAAPGAYAGILAWHGRADWLDIVVETVIQACPEVLKRHSVGKDLFRRWAAVKSVYAQRRSGRQCITRPKVLASTLLCKERQVQRCNAAARELGLEVCVLKGRMLTFEESTACRSRGSNQRGLSSEVALPTPPGAEAAVQEARQVHKHPAPAGVSVDSDTPTSGYSRNHSPHQRRTHPCAARGAKADGATRRQQHKRAPHPAFTLAQALIRRVPWLHGTAPQRILGAVAPFAKAPLPWTAEDLQLAMGAQATRNGTSAHITPGGARIPWALLRHVLAQIDPYADHPRLPEIQEQSWHTTPTPCDHPDCDGYGWHNTTTGAQRCPARTTPR